jgi:hypothetical protein
MDCAHQDIDLDFVPFTSIFKADSPYNKCNEVRLVQIYFSWSDVFSFTPKMGGWWVDAGKTNGRRDLWYPYGRWGDPSASPSSMQDNPFHPNVFWRNVSKFYAETCAVCSNGPARGSVYGCVLWGHDMDKRTMDFRYFGWSDMTIAWGTDFNVDIMLRDQSTQDYSRKSWYHVKLGDAHKNNTFNFRGLPGARPTHQMQSVLDDAFMTGCCGGLYNL